MNIYTTTLSAAYQYYNDTDKFNIKIGDLLKVDDRLVEQSKGLFNKSMNAETAMAIIKKPKTLLQQAQHNVLECYCNNKKLDIHPLKLPVYDFMNACYRIATNNRFLSAYLFKDHVEHCMTECLNSLPKSLNNWINRDEYTQVCKDTYKELLANSVNIDDKRILPKYVAERLLTFKNLLANKKLEIHVGAAGCGKSTSVVNTLVENNYTHLTCVYALSNTICNMFKQKLPDVKTCSFSKAKYVGPVTSKVVVIDEFSQIGFEWLDTLIDILSNAHVTNVYIMGDINQIPTFLSSGSLLYSVMQEFKDCVIEHTTCYRNKDAKALNTMLSKVLTQQNLDNSDMIINTFSSVTEEQFKNIDCIVTGTNEHVRVLNQLLCNVKYNTDIQSDCVYDYAHLKDLQIIAKNTINIDNVSVSRNERFTVKAINSLLRNVIIESNITHEVIRVTEHMLNLNFELGYAITVNRAQGLEWESVLVYVTQSDRNLFSYNALYVALSRAKHVMLFVTTDRADARLTLNDINCILNKCKYRFTNNFAEICNNNTIN